MKDRIQTGVIAWRLAVWPLIVGLSVGWLATKDSELTLYRPLLAGTCSAAAVFGLLWSFGVPNLIGRLIFALIVCSVIVFVAKAFSDNNVLIWLVGISIFLLVFGADWGIRRKRQSAELTKEDLSM